MERRFYIEKLFITVDLVLISAMLIISTIVGFGQKFYFNQPIPAVVVNSVYIFALYYFIRLYRTLYIKKKPIVIIDEDSVNIYEFIRNGYVRINFKDIKNVWVISHRRSMTNLALNVDNYGLYLRQAPNIFVKIYMLCSLPFSILATFKFKKILIFSHLHHFLSLEDFDEVFNLVEEGARMARNEKN